MRAELLSLEATAAAAAAIGACVQTMLGPSVTLKMVAEDDGSGELTSDVLALIGALHVHHPVGAIIEELCSAQAEEVGNGLTTLVALSGALALAARDLVRLGVRIDSVLSGFDECALICAATLSHVRVPSRALLEWGTSGPAHAACSVATPSSSPAPACADDERELGALAQELDQLRRRFELPPGGDDQAEMDWFFDEALEEVREPCALHDSPLPQSLSQPRQPLRNPSLEQADANGAMQSERGDGDAVEAAAASADDRELELLAASLAHGREREMALAAAAARAVGLTTARFAHGGAAGRRCAADDALALVRVSRLVGRLGQESRVLAATMVVELERADAERLACALAGEGPSPRLLAVCIDGDGGICRFAPHHSSAAAQPGATAQVVRGVGDFGARAAAAEDAEDAHARAFVHALERVCAEWALAADGTRTRALVAVRGSASSELDERLRAAGHLLVTHLSGRELRDLAALAGARLSPPMADAREAVAWLCADGARPSRLLRADVWRDGWTPELEAKTLRPHAERARGGHESSWRLALSARPCDAASARGALERGRLCAQAASAHPAAKPPPDVRLHCAVMLYAPSEPAAQDAERAFCRCLSRLRNAVLAQGESPLGSCLGLLLPGGGACDVACLCALRDRASRARKDAMGVGSKGAACARLLELAEVVGAFARALESTVACALVNCGLSPVAAIDLCADAMARWTACNAAAAVAHKGHLWLLESSMECAPICEAVRRLALPAQLRLTVLACDDPISRASSFDNAVAAVRLVLLSDTVVIASYNR